MEETEVYKAYSRSPFLSMKHTTYFEPYEQLFSQYRGQNITFVEIGILNGGSLFMWRDFFGPEARIIGIDLNPAAQKWEEHGFEIFIGSQSDENFWRETLAAIGPIDVLLDDGGHTYEQQIITTECALDHIKDGGMLVVEDTHTSYMRGFGPKRYSFVNYVKSHIDRINRRFKKFHTPEADTRVWSVQVFESIVVFHVNRAASQRLSHHTKNGGKGESAKDFRYFDNPVYEKHKDLGKHLRFIDSIPGSKDLKKSFWKTVIKIQGAKNIRKYFR
ncbi:class I SAM-dependent methyltransferase [Shimia sp. R9_3]|uniref:class I SAM-dependent methyltransferase n=1 Tax=Shimia sp. R9_3 TaxID=2821113 RepID=UPI001ADB435B|nr:class I SAM-dependent methyltransferase [Shimia sp. R9_3]MBO9400815.1 class I SAM-dependent methyltransferase [Shimia sp. R9_3]